MSDFTNENKIVFWRNLNKNKEQQGTVTDTVCKLIKYLQNSYIHTYTEKNN